MPSGSILRQIFGDTRPQRGEILHTSTRHIPRHMSRITHTKNKEVLHLEKKKQQTLQAMEIQLGLHVCFTCWTSEYGTRSLASTWWGWLVREGSVRGFFWDRVLLNMASFVLGKKKREIRILLLVLMDYYLMQFAPETPPLIFNAEFQKTGISGFFHLAVFSVWAHSVSGGKKSNINLKKHIANRNILIPGLFM